MNSKTPFNVNPWTIAIFITASFWISSTTGTNISLTPKQLESKKTGSNFAINCQLDVIDGAAAQDVTPPSWSKVSGDGAGPIPMSGRVHFRQSDRKSAMLKINNANLADAGEYKCTSGDLSASTTLKVHKSISFIDTPTEQHPIVGNEATIKCRAIADPEATISWRMKDQEEALATNGGRYTVSKEGDLKIPDFSIERDNGVYVCDALQQENGDMQSLEINVTGYLAPTSAHLALIEKERWSKGVHEDATNIRMTCTAGGVPAPTYNWSKDGIELVEDGHFKMPQPGLLEISRMNRDDGGDYRCVAKNQVGEASAQLTVDVFKKPTIGKMEKRTVMADQDVSFVCVHQGTEPMHAVWVNLGKVILSKSQDDLASDAVANTNNSEMKHEKYVIVDDGRATLHLKGVKLTDAGEYQCRVSNDAGTANESVNLEVQRSPLIVSKTLGKVRAVLNTEQTLHCEALAVPEANWSWWKDNAQLSDEVGRVETKLSSGGDKNHFVSTLKVTLTRDTDFGNYVCKADNGLTSPAESTIEIIKIEPPAYPDMNCDGDQKPTIITMQIPAFSSSHSEQQWPNTVDIIVSRKSDSSYLETVSLKFESNGFYKIPKLDPTTKYVFNVSGRNEAGTSTSGVIDCETMVPAPPGQPLFADKEPIRCNYTSQCAIQWSLDDTGGKDILQYQIKYRPFPNEGEEEQEFQTAYTVQKNYVFSNLKPRTTYQVQVRAQNAEGWGEPAEMKLITPDESTQVTGDVVWASKGPSAGAVVGIVIIVVLIVLVLVDVACYYVNHCGLLMNICVHLCGKPAPEMKTKEAMIESGCKETTIDDPCKKQPLKSEQFPCTETSESTPMISGSGGQNGHHERKDTPV